MTDEIIKIRFQGEDAETSRRLLASCNRVEIGPENITPRIPGRRGHNIDLDFFEVVLELLGLLPLDLIIDTLVDYIKKVIEDANEKNEDGKPISVKITIDGGAPIECRTQDDIEKIENAIRTQLKSKQNKAK